ncbi:MAG: hypothetical protein AB1568_13005 [Thermodesulfobacteriota bacterium]
MKKSVPSPHPVLGRLATAALCVGLAWAGNAFAADSSCITCHTDVDALENTLAPVKVSASAKQSGAG